MDQIRVYMENSLFIGLESFAPWSPFYTCLVYITMYNSSEILDDSYISNLDVLPFICFGQPFIL